MLTITVPIELRSANRMKGHPIHQGRIAKRERRDTYFAAHEAGIRGWRRQNHAPYLVTFRRVIGPHRRAYDEGDNNRLGFKHIRDEVAALLGVNDGPNDPVKWVYADPVRGPVECCEITISTVDFNTVTCHN